ncbi:MAG TPA: COX15/CtaA family protein [Burkholderiales bacterium]|nr:COX15/CtaA family protein [Burkholderiales bacterium]
MTRRLATIAAVLAFIVVVAGAYVRLSDAGLGCPDWPFCYGQPVPERIADHDALAKAWKEMGHRYLAGALVLVVVALAALSWRAGRARWISLGVLALILFQATLGAWTVTKLLKPAIVTAHLLGGMSILALLTWLALEESSLRFQARALRAPALLALLALAVQIALGGWVSSNYAALACPDLPLCHGALVPPMDFRDAFRVVRELGQTAEGTLLGNDALTAIHWTHRMFALVVLALAGWAAWRAAKLARPLGVIVGAMVILQFSLGVLNVAVSRPLPLAAAHNAGAAALLVALVVLNFVAFRSPRAAP